MPSTEGLTKWKRRAQKNSKDEIIQKNHKPNTLQGLKTGKDPSGKMGDPTSQNKEDTVLSFAHGRKDLLENGRPWQAILEGQVLF
jgi:hypothetical protein